VGPRAGLDAVLKKKIPSPYEDSNPYTTDLPRLLTDKIRKNAAMSRGTFGGWAV